MRCVEVAIGRTDLGWVGSIVGRIKNQAGPKLARIFHAKILTIQLALKIGLVGPNNIFKAKKKIGRIGLNLARFFLDQ